MLYLSQHAALKVQLTTVQRMKAQTPTSELGTLIPMSFTPELTLSPGIKKC